MHKIDAIHNAKISANFKREMLKILWQEVGPSALLETGQAVTTAGYDPVWYLAVRSSSPNILFDKWHRFEKFSHSNNRVKIDIQSENSVHFSRYKTEGGVPTDAENLLVCGIMIALLEAIGCQNLVCKIPSLDDPLIKQDGAKGEENFSNKLFSVRSWNKFILPSDLARLNTGYWLISWSAFTPKPLVPIQLNYITNLELPPIKDAQTKSKIDTLGRHLLNDIVRQWKIGELAEETGYSIRSLQRLLTKAGLSFSHLIRLIRVQESCRLLRETTNSITITGYCTGFSDSAHFSRDFRASMGMTPSDYRKLFQDKSHGGFSNK